MYQRVLYGTLKGEMAKYGYTNRDMSKLLNMTYVGFSKKLRGQIQWKSKEIDLICNLFGKTYEELFRKENLNDEEV
ncbi:MAG: hypothetical protein U0L22_08145 [Bacteroidales bacterium]|nr:hypothetical protein [Bacteroidales bacterium]